MGLILVPMDDEDLDDIEADGIRRPPLCPECDEPLVPEPLVTDDTVRFALTCIYHGVARIVDPWEV